MAEMRMVASLIERQRISELVPPPPEAEDPNEVEEMRRRFAMLEVRSSTVEHTRPPLAHEVKGGAPILAPRRNTGTATTKAVKTYGGAKKDITTARSVTSAAVSPSVYHCNMCLMYIIYLDIIYYYEPLSCT